MYMYTYTYTYIYIYIYIVQPGVTTFSKVSGLVYFPYKAARVLTVEKLFLFFYFDRRVTSRNALRSPDCRSA